MPIIRTRKFEEKFVADITPGELMEDSERLTRVILGRQEAFEVLVALSFQALDQADYGQLEDTETMANRYMILSRLGWPENWPRLCPACGAKMKQIGGNSIFETWWCLEGGEERSFPTGLRLQSLDIPDRKIHQIVVVG